MAKSGGSAAKAIWTAVDVAAASVTIAPVHPQTTPALHVPVAAADKAVKRKLDTDERNNALRLAVVGFNDH